MGQDTLYETCLFYNKRILLIENKELQCSNFSKQKLDVIYTNLAPGEIDRVKAYEEKMATINEKENILRASIGAVFLKLESTDAAE